MSAADAWPRSVSQSTEALRLEHRGANGSPRAASRAHYAVAITGDRVGQEVPLNTEAGFGDRMAVTQDPQLAALESLYELRLDAFVRTAAAITGDRESGRDAVNEAFVAAIRHRGQFRGEGTLEAWVWRVVVREALKTRRRSGRRVRRERESASAATNGHLDHTSELLATVALLPERQRLILFLRYYADLDYQQIADALHLRRGTVSAALHSAHHTLRRHLEEMIER
jgi:RNA polymerase sigma-70 factor, ECF subfamily